MDTTVPLLTFELRRAEAPELLLLDMTPIEPAIAPATRSYALNLAQAMELRERLDASIEALRLELAFERAADVRPRSVRSRLIIGPM